MASKNQFITFNNGQKYPIVGFGTWKVNIKLIKKTGITYIHINLI